MCMSRRYPPPSYETTDTVGLPHERQFTITCVVLKNREIGQGKSKKLAKRKAAHKMFNRLRDFPIETNEMTKYLDDENNDEVNYRYTTCEEAINNMILFVIRFYHYKINNPELRYLQNILRINFMTKKRSVK